MGILTKAAPTLTEDNFIDIMPVAWELMLESDQELAAAAGSCMFFVAPAYHHDLKFSDTQVWANSVVPDQTAPNRAVSGAVWPGSALFAIPSAYFGHISYGKTTLFKFQDQWGWGSIFFFFFFFTV